MSKFQQNFGPDPDPDLASIRRIWTTEKPLLRDSVVKFAPPYPDDAEIELEDDEEPTTDPSCPSARDSDHEVQVANYNVCDNGFGSLQENAWEHLSAHNAAVEKSLRNKLYAWHLKRHQQFLEEDLPELEELQTHWSSLESEIDWHTESAVDFLFKLVSIALIDSGLDETGFVAYEFQTGWDQDHGASVIMHNTNVLAAGGMGEFTTGGDIVAGIQAVQRYDLDDGDLSLLNT